MMPPNLIVNPSHYSLNLLDHNFHSLFKCCLLAPILDLRRAQDPFVVFKMSSNMVMMVFMLGQ